MTEDFFTRDDLLAALRQPGVNQARLARGLGVEPPRISEWKRERDPVENGTYTRADLARAVRVAQGVETPAVPAEGDAAALLNALEDDARRMLDRIAAARAATRLPTPRDATARGTAALAALDAVRVAPASDAVAPARRRRGHR